MSQSGEAYCHRGWVVRACIALDQSLSLELVAS